MRSSLLAASLVFLLSGRAHAASPVLASLDFSDADKPVEVMRGDLKVRLSAGPIHAESGGADSIAELSTPGGTLKLVLGGDESPSAMARIVRLAAGDEPQILFQRAATGSAACVESKLGVFVGGAWRAIDLDRVCENEDGYDIVDIDGDGVGELVSKVGYFDVFEDHPHEAREPIRIQRLVAGRIVIVTGARRFHDYLRKSLPGGPETPPKPDGAVEGTPNYTGPAAWMATKALLGETREGWAAMGKAFGHDRRTFEVCAVRAIRDQCPAGQTVARPFLAALALVLAANNYVKGRDELSIP